MNPSTNSGIALWAVAAALASPALAMANERQACLNQCTQTGATEQVACKAKYDSDMIKCGQLNTNELRTVCKRTANADTKACAKSARDKIKQCQADCPPKR